MLPNAHVLKTIASYVSSSFSVILNEKVNLVLFLHHVPSETPRYFYIYTAVLRPTLRLVLKRIQQKQVCMWGWHRILSGQRWEQSDGVAFF